MKHSLVYSSMKIRTSIVIAFLFFISFQIAQSQSIQLQLTPSNYNGYNISCFGVQDGSINLTVSGGTAPYEYRWSNGILTEDISGLPAGYYNVEVIDANKVHKQAEITLEEPLQIRATLTPSIYSNGFNVSCFSCSNGTRTLCKTPTIG